MREAKLCLRMSILNSCILLDNRLIVSRVYDYISKWNYI